MPGCFEHDIHTRVPLKAQTSLYDHFIFIQQNSPWSELSQRHNSRSLYLRVPSDIPPVNSYRTNVENRVSS